MKTSGLGELEAVLAVARHRNFRAAATELGISTNYSEPMGCKDNHGYC
jgi:hypothetical protein